MEITNARVSEWVSVNSKQDKTENMDLKINVNCNWKLENPILYFPRIFQTKSSLKKHKLEQPEVDLLI